MFKGYGWRRRILVLGCVGRCCLIRSGEGGMEEREVRRRVWKWEKEFYIVKGKYVCILGYFLVDLWIINKCLSVYF